MFYVSKVTPLFFLLSFIDLFYSVLSRFFKYDHIDMALIAVFGFILHAILGAAYQIIPNSQQTQLKFQKFSYIVFFLATISSILLYIKWFLPASIFTFLSVLLFSFHTLPVIKNIKPVTVKFLLISVLYMNVAAMLFLLAGLTGNILYQTAIHTMTVGSMLNAILGVELAWIPMLLMHTLNVRFANTFFYIHQVSTLALFGSFYYFDYSRIMFAGIFELFVLSLFFFIVFKAWKSHTIGKIPYVVKYFTGGLLFLAFGILMGIHLSASKMLQFIEVHLDAMVFGFGGLTVLGAMVHLLPRIVWNMVYIKKAQEGKQIPNVFQVIKEKEANIAFYLLFAGAVFSVSAEFLLKREIASAFYILPLLYFFYMLFYRLYIFYKK